MILDIPHRDEITDFDNIPTSLITMFKTSTLNAKIDDVGS